MTLMIIDDDDDDREIFCDAINQIDKSIQCLKCSYAEDALHILATLTNKPDLIFLDLNMPRVNGRQCLIRMRSNNSLKEIPVIIYSTSKSEKEKQELIRMGAHAFITKPNSIADLIQIIQPIVQKASTNFLPTF